MVAAGGASPKLPAPKPLPPRPQPQAQEYPVYKITSAEKARDYLKDAKVGEGTYAVVYQGTQLSTQRKIAIKKIKLGQFKDGMDLSAVREIKFLRELSHPNVVQMIDVLYHKQSLHLVLEFLETDLEAVIKASSLVFTAADVKSWMLMTLRGIYHCHRQWILHRDLKPNNLLLAADGQLKLADFGLARVFGEPHRGMTSQVVTRWYRAPELLFGARDYGGNVDMWAIGAIFAELMLRTPFLAGESDIDQLNKTFQALGTPSEREWPGLTKLPDYTPFKRYAPTPLASIFTAASDDALDLLGRLLQYDPRTRISAEDALKHSYVTGLPRPTLPADLPRPGKLPAAAGPRGARIVHGETIDAPEHVAVAAGASSSRKRRASPGPSIFSAASEAAALATGVDGRPSKAARVDPRG